MMNFEDLLYEEVCAIFPSMTVRSFSQSLGMSVGYWSSIRAQGLPVSNVALLQLNDYLAVRGLLLESGSYRARKLKATQRLIAREIVSRFAKQIESLEGTKEELEIYITQTHDASEEGFDALPFVMVCG